MSVCCFHAWPGKDQSTRANAVLDVGAGSMASLPADDWAEVQWLEQQTCLQLAWTPGLQAAACKAAKAGNIAVLHTILTCSGYTPVSIEGHRHYCPRFSMLNCQRMFSGRLYPAILQREAESLRGSCHDPIVALS